MDEKRLSVVRRLPNIWPYKVYLEKFLAVNFDHRMMWLRLSSSIGEVEQIFVASTMSSAVLSRYDMMSKIPANIFLANTVPVDMKMVKKGDLRALFFVRSRKATRKQYVNKETTSRHIIGIGSIVLQVASSDIHIKLGGEHDHNRQP